MRMVGRPTKKTETVIAEICDRISGGESLVSICQDEHMPSTMSVFRWLAADDSFRDRYARAREAQADALAEELLAIADDATNDYMATNGDDAVGYKLIGENIQRSKLRIDTRKWLLAKLAPKKYGDRIMQEHSGSLGLTHEQALALLDHDKT